MKSHKLAEYLLAAPDMDVLIELQASVLARADKVNVENYCVHPLHSDVAGWPGDFDGVCDIPVEEKKGVVIR